MDYYAQLYDIDFLSRPFYRAEAGAASVDVREGGFPVWETWRAPRLSADEAQKAWRTEKRDDADLSCLSAASKGADTDADLLLTLLGCEDAYRHHDGTRFFPLNRLLCGSKDKTVRMKGIKLHYAWESLAFLARFQGAAAFLPPLRAIGDQALAYLARQKTTPRVYSMDDIKVEKPVREDWQRCKLSTTDKAGVERFYKTSFSYILELTAANHQVQTLFNYAVILSMLRKLGVKSLFDYGAGIGSFVALAASYGIAGTHADFDSETLRYAKERYRQLGLDVPTVVLNENASLPAQVDCIVCTEVLEHVYDPEALVRRMNAALRPGGLLVVSESFDYVDAFCTHLPMHQGKGGKNFMKFMRGSGFRPLPTGYLLHPSLHVKTAESTQPKSSSRRAKKQATVHL
jgi:hypothetical protein